MNAKKQGSYGIFRCYGIYEGTLETFLLSHNILLNRLPARFHDETRIIERKHRLAETVLNCSQHAVTMSSECIFLFTAAFLSNIFFGSNTQSAFELGIAYKHAMLRISVKIILVELIEAHKL